MIFGNVLRMVDIFLVMTNGAAQHSHFSNKWTLLCSLVKSNKHYLYFLTVENSVSSGLCSPPRHSWGGFKLRSVNFSINFKLEFFAHHSHQTNN